MSTPLEFKSAARPGAITALLESKRDPRDGDGDGWINEGTLRKRRAPVRPSGFARLDVTLSMKDFDQKGRDKINAKAAEIGHTTRSINRNIDASFDLTSELTPEEYAAARDWYRIAHEDLTTHAENVGFDPQTGLWMAAVLSPQKSWPENLRAARYTMERIASGRPLALDEAGRARVETWYMGQVGKTLLTPAQRAALPQGKDMQDARVQAGVEAYIAAFGPYHLGADHLSEIDNVHVAGRALFVEHNALALPGNGWGAGSGMKPYADALAIASGFTPDDVLYAVDGSPLKSPIVNQLKVRSFANNLTFPDDPEGDDVTIDVWMFRAAAGRIITDDEMKQMNDAPSFGGKAVGVKPLIADSIRRVAKREGLQAHQVQALIWEAWRKRVGLTEVRTNVDRVADRDAFELRVAARRKDYSPDLWRLDPMVAENWSAFDDEIDPWEADLLAVLDGDDLESKADPRDGDGDGLVYEGTPRERPAVARRPKVHSVREVYEATDDYGLTLPQGMQASTYIRTGPLGDVVVKNFAQGNSRFSRDVPQPDPDREVWGSRVAELLGVRAPRCESVGDQMVAMDLVTGPDGERAPTLFEWIKNLPIPEDELDARTAEAMADTRADGSPYYGPEEEPLVRSQARFAMRREAAEALTRTPEGRRLALFDFLAANVDRHEGNVLVVDGKLVAIDHSMVMDARNYGFTRPEGEFLWTDSVDSVFSKAWIGQNVRSTELSQEDLNVGWNAITALEADPGSIPPEVLQGMRHRMERLQDYLDADPERAEFLDAVRSVEDEQELQRRGELLLAKKRKDLVNSIEGTIFKLKLIGDAPPAEVEAAIATLNEMIDRQLVGHMDALTIEELRQKVEGLRP